MANEPEAEMTPTGNGSVASSDDGCELYTGTKMNGNADDDERAKMETTDNDKKPEKSGKSAESAGKAGKRKYRNKDKKQCSVCGDKALGYNFDAVSCESCKAFFRRNALKRKIPPCMFSGKCKIDVYTRRFCSHCRLEKCFAAGMKKDMILDEKEKKERIDKMKKNKEQRLLSQQLGISILASPSSTIPPSPSTDSDHPNTPIKQEIPDHDDVTNPDYPMDPNDPLPSPFTIDPSAPQPARALTPDETALINYLTQAYHHSFYNLEENPDENSTLNHLVNYSGLIVRKLIKFAKKVDDFTCLDQESQIWLLKGVVLSTLFLRSAEHYNPERDAWITPTSEIKTIVLKRATGYGRFHEDHMRYCKTVKTLTQDDPTIMTLLQLVALFYPDRPNVPDREMVSNIQDKYICFLKHYLESRFSFRQARYLLPKLLSKMNELQELTENHGRVLLHVNPSEIEPLMLEIFDLK